MKNNIYVTGVSMFVSVLFYGCLPKPLSLVSSKSSVDLNGLKENPVWGYQKRHKMKAPLVKHFFSGDVAKFTPGKTRFTSDSIYIDPYKTHTGFSFCNGINGYGHVNWYPITYTCRLNWGSYSGDGLLSDNDYTLSLYRRDSALVTKTTTGDDVIICEFDGKETINNWGGDSVTDVWDSLREYRNNDSACEKLIGNRYAMVIGLFGVDCVHDCHSELHPVYAMFVHLSGSDSTDIWAFFVRNWGNEGFCGTSEHIWPVHSIRVLLPRPGAENLKFLPPSHIAFVSIQGRVNAEKKLYSVSMVKDTGALFTFTMPGATVNSEGVYEGELYIKWKLNSPANVKPLNSYNEFDIKPPANAPSHQTDEPCLCADKGITDRILKLDSASQAELYKALNNAATYNNITIKSMKYRDLNSAITASCNYPHVKPVTARTVLVPRKQSQIEQTLQLLNVMENLWHKRKTK